jgi:hypothetical protein
MDFFGLAIPRAKSSKGRRQLREGRTTCQYTADPSLIEESRFAMVGACPRESLASLCLQAMACAVPNAVLCLRACDVQLVSIAPFKSLYSGEIFQDQTVPSFDAFHE